MTITDTNTDDQTGSEDTGTDTGTDQTAEVEKWKAQARKHEERAKANAKAAAEYEAFKQQSMTDTEKALAQAVATTAADTRAAVLREVGGSLVTAQFRVAAAGRPIDVDALLGGIDVAKFLDDEAGPNMQAISAYVDKIAPAVADGKPVFPDLGQGVRGGHQSRSPAQDFAEFLSGQLKG